MKFYKIFTMFLIIIVGIFCVFSQKGFAQFPFGSLGFPWISHPFYSPFVPFGRNYFPYANIFPPFYGNNLALGGTFAPMSSPAPALLSPYPRSPNATIIFTSPTLTLVGGTTPGVILIGATGVLGAPVVATPTAIATPAPVIQTVANPTPAPLFSLLAVLYASGLLDGKALLSTANPLLFAYLTTLLF
ncbi:hypothetical protein JXL19_01855 [bacterium]|nr:hypothetical protein [bacterium]